jgi:hypothetical protein
VEAVITSIAVPVGIPSDDDGYLGEFPLRKSVVDVTAYLAARVIYKSANTAQQTLVRMVLDRATERDLQLLLTL